MRGSWMHLAVFVAVLTLVTGCASVVPAQSSATQPAPASVPPTAAPEPTSTRQPTAAPKPTETIAAARSPTSKPTAAQTSVLTATPHPQARADTYLRSGPSTDFPTASHISAGDELEIVARSSNGKWLKAGSGLWISSDLVKNPPAGPLEVIPDAVFTPTATAPPTPKPTPATPMRVAPKVIHYAQPSLQIDRAIYDSVPCDPDKWWEPCTALGAGCKALLRADSLLGGLSPSYPIAACLLSEGLGGVYTQPCRGGGPVGYFVLREGQYQMIASESELRELYAPIESEDEALSYALAATGYQARNFTTGLLQHAYPVPGKVDYFVKELEDTHVTKSQEGYRVRLYDYTWCGCGHHETYPMDVLVTASGVISTTKGAPVYQLRPEACID